MSLNGLEDSLILTASEIAGGEPEGWMLLKYASRDEVELHATGFGGFEEMRESIANYKDESPLYGFLNYREKKVVLKYQPDECSRLVQARATVHFGMICERFQPYDHTYEISESKQLRDSKLAAACDLEPLVPSEPASPQRRRRLGEISEEGDADEEHPATRRKSAHFDSDNDHDHDDSEDRPKSPVSGPPVTLNSDLAHSPDASKFTLSDQPPTFVGADHDLADTSSLQATRSAELYPYPSYKPKVKLGPRPSEAPTRPGSSSSSNIRPISSLPAGFKASKAKKEKKNRDKEHHSDKLAESPEITAGASLSPGNRPHTSSGSSAISIGSMVPPPPSPTASLPPAKDRITPEKARLMKAMKMREKRMNKVSVPSDKANGAPDSLKPHDDDDGVDTDGPSQIETDGPSQLEIDGSSQLETDGPSQLEEEAQDESRPSMSHTDSGIVIDSSLVGGNTDQASELTHSESHPPSPILEASSEQANSTKASSISEDTNDTETAPVIEEKEAETVTEPVVEEPKIEEPEAKVEEPESKVEEPESKTEEAKPEPKEQVHVQVTVPEDTKDAAVLSPVQEESSSDTEPSKPNHAEPAKLQPSDDIDCPVSPTTIPLAQKDTPAAIDTSLSLPSVTTPASLEQERSPKRRPAEPIQTDLKAAADVKAVQSDLKVIQSDLKEKTSYEKILAVEEQAKRLSASMNQTPVTPIFPTPSVRPSSPASSRPYSSCSTRTVSQPSLRASAVVLPADVTASSARSVSSGAGAAYLHKITQQSSSTLATKSTGKLGSSISQRIKALEQKSTSAGGSGINAGSGSGASGSISRPTTSSTFYSVRKSIVMDPAQSPALSAAGGLGRSPSRKSRDSVALGSGSRERSSSVASRMSRFELDRIESSVQVQVQVTARINQNPGAMDGMSQAASLQHRISTLNPDMGGNRAQSPVRTSFHERRISKELNRRTDEETEVSDPLDGEQGPLLSPSTPTSTSDGSTFRRRSSLTYVKDFIKDRRRSVTANERAGPASASPARPPSVFQNNTNTGGYMRRLSISSRRSSFSRERDSVEAAARSPTQSLDAGDDSDKKLGKAGRFIQRLSSGLTARVGKAQVTVAPTVQEETIAAMGSAAVRARPKLKPTGEAEVTYLGDVNVQFPDNLLWKRRTMGLDNLGFLILTPATASSAARADKLGGAGLKRFHLSDFKMPYVPDMELQELPNSVCLDFVEGSALQIACEDRNGQVAVLNVLQAAYQVHGN